jgi:hypothetical protein
VPSYARPATTQPALQPLTSYEKPGLFEGLYDGMMKYLG